MKTWAIAENNRLFEQYLKQTKQTRDDITLLWGVGGSRGIRGKLVLIGDYFLSSAYDGEYIGWLVNTGELEVVYYNPYLQ